MEQRPAHPRRGPPREERRQGGRARSAEPRFDGVRKAMRRAPGGSRANFAWRCGPLRPRRRPRSRIAHALIPERHRLSPGHPELGQREQHAQQRGAPRQPTVSPLLAQMLRLRLVMLSGCSSLESMLGLTCAIGSAIASFESVVSSSRRRTGFNATCQCGQIS